MSVERRAWLPAAICVGAFLCAWGVRALVESDGGRVATTSVPIHVSSEPATEGPRLVPIDVPVPSTPVDPAAASATAPDTASPKITAASPTMRIAAPGVSLSASAADAGASNGVADAAPRAPLSAPPRIRDAAAAPVAPNASDGFTGAGGGGSGYTGVTAGDSGYTGSGAGGSGFTGVGAGGSGYTGAGASPDGGR